MPTSTESNAVGPLAAHRGAAEQLLAQVLSRTCPAPLWTHQPSVSISAAVAEVLGPFSAADPDPVGQLSALGTGRAAWVAVDGDRVAALLSLTLRRVRLGDPEYSYLPPAYAALGMAATLVDRRSDLPALRWLFRARLDLDPGGGRRPGQCAAPGRRLGHRLVLAGTGFPPGHPARCWAARP